MAQKIKSTTTAPRKNEYAWFIVAGVVLLAVLSGALIKAGHPKLQRVYYGYQVRSALKNERKKLQDPLGSFGFANLEGGKSICVYGVEYGYASPKLICRAEVHSYTVLPADAAGKQAMNAKARALSDLMAKNGWKSGNSPLVPWFQGITEGKDYQPDQFNYKHVGNMFCMLDYTTAFSKPKPPAMSVTMQCSAPEPKKIGGQL